MIGAAFLARLWGSAPEPNPPAARALDLALTELRCALACFDLVDDAVRAEGAAPTEGGSMARVYAEWNLARSAERFGRAYAVETDAKARP